jgi:hypothetical protein
LVHVDQAPKAPSTQSTMQPCALQLRASAECGQALPPGSTVTESCASVPHD